jgi:hypothetical protein
VLCLGEAQDQVVSMLKKVPGVLDVLAAPPGGPARIV